LASNVPQLKLHVNVFVELENFQGKVHPELRTKKKRKDRWIEKKRKKIDRLKERKEKKEKREEKRKRRKRRKKR